MTARMRVALATPRSRLTLAALTLAFFAAYMVLDLREGGRSSNLLTTRLSTPSFYIAHFGGWFFWGSVGLDIVLAAASALLVLGSASLYRSRRAATGGFCTSTATLLFGFAVFGCPGCVMPLFGTLGVTLFANVLPLLGLEFKVVSIAITLAAIAFVFRQPRAVMAEVAGRRPSFVP